MKKVLYARAMAVIVLMFALLLVSACSTEQLEDQSGKAQSEGIREPSEKVGYELQSFLVPIAHLTLDRESMSMEELSQTQKLAVARELQEMVGELLGRSDFQSFDSSDAVLEHVSRTPESVGPIPWDKVDPRVKALAVNGKPLLEPGTAGLESYPLQQASSSGPDTQKLRRIVAAGDVVMARGMPYMVFDQERGIGFLLDGGYAAVTARVPEPSQASEFGIIHQFNAECRGGSWRGKKVPARRRSHVGEP